VLETKYTRLNKPLNICLQTSRKLKELKKFFFNQRNQLPSEKKGPKSLECITNHDIRTQELIYAN